MHCPKRNIIMFGAVVKKKTYFLPPGPQKAKKIISK